MSYDGVYGLSEKPSIKLCDLIDYKVSAREEEIVRYNTRAFKRIIGR